MPRKAKEELEEKIVKKVASGKKTKKDGKVTTKKAVSKKETATSLSKKTPSKKNNVTKKETETKKTANKTTKEKKATSTKKVTKKSETAEKPKKSTTKKADLKSKTLQNEDIIEKEPKKTKKNNSKKENTTSKKSVAKKDKKASTVKKSTKKKETLTNEQLKPTIKTSTKKSTTRKPKIEVLEYYDLPYRYNQTVIKLLAQTPTTLFVYWDISDEDKKQYINQYGEYFFNNTRPILMVHNKTKNYTFEVPINDFANSWYLHINDSDCDYQIELGRRPINEYVQIENNYMYITSSNNVESPNDHILFDELSHFIYFYNVKTKQTTQKNIANLEFLRKIGKISSIKEFYKKMYPEENISFAKLNLDNPSSATSSSFIN